jgi:hypothetical protein
MTVLTTNNIELRLVTIFYDNYDIFYDNYDNYDIQRHATTCYDKLRHSTTSYDILYQNGSNMKGHNQERTEVIIFNA